MNRFIVIRTTLAIGALVLSTGCAQPSLYRLGKAFDSVPPPPSAMAQVVFYFAPDRGATVAQFEQPYLALHDGEQEEDLGGLIVNSYLIHHAAPGPHEYWIGGRGLAGQVGQTWVPCTLEPGKTYFIRYRHTNALLVGWGVLDFVPEEEALEDLYGMREVRRKSVAVSQK